MKQRGYYLSIRGIINITHKDYTLNNNTFLVRNNDKAGVLIFRSLQVHFQILKFNKSFFF